MRHFTAFVSGFLFALGLALSGMVKPVKVIGFLDVAGAWDPSLAFVMAGALAIFIPGYRWATRHPAPVAEERFDLPTQKAITSELVTGAAIFGVGWGVAGSCPGAAVASAATLAPSTISVIVGMAIGIVAMRTVRDARGAATARPAPVADF